MLVFHPVFLNFAFFHVSSLLIFFYQILPTLNHISHTVFNLNNGAMHRYISSHFCSSCMNHHLYLHLGLVPLQWVLIHQLQTLVKKRSTNGGKLQKCVWIYSCSYHHMMYVEMPRCNTWQFYANKPSLFPPFSTRC